MDPSPQRVEIVIPVRTMVVVLAFALLVALAVLSIGTLLSIFVAAVLALGLDPIVGRDWSARGWKRGRAALVVFAALFAFGVRARARDGRPAVGSDQGVHRVAAGVLGRSPAGGLVPEPDVDGRTRTTRSATRSRTSPPACPTRPTRCSASPAASSARCCRW